MLYFVDADVTLESPFFEAAPIWSIIPPRSGWEVFCDDSGSVTGVQPPPTVACSIRGSPPDLRKKISASPAAGNKLMSLLSPDRLSLKADSVPASPGDSTAVLRPFAAVSDVSAFPSQPFLPHDGLEGDVTASTELPLAESPPATQPESHANAVASNPDSLPASSGTPSQFLFVPSETLAVARAGDDADFAAHPQV